MKTSRNLRDEFKAIQRKFWDAPAILAEILLTTDRRGEITLTEIRKLWGLRGQRMAEYLIGNETTDALTTKTPCSQVAQQTPRARALIITKHGRTIIRALERLVEVAVIYEGGL